MTGQSRVYDGFSELTGGMNLGISPSLLPASQCSASRDFTFRGGFPKTRPPFLNLPLTFDSPTTQQRWSGKYQGSCYYNSPFGQSGFIVSVGGRLFRIVLGAQNMVSEITPQITIVTTEEFTVPAVSASVNVAVNSETVISVGDTVFIDSGEYLVTNRFTDGLTLEYQGGAANATVAAGASVLDASQDLIIEFQTNPDFYEFVYLFQAETYVIVLAGQNRPVIFDGSSCRLSNFDEVPPGVMGAYGWGRIWICLPNRSGFVAGDIVYGDGTVASILKFTENDFLNEGGVFSVPLDAGLITAMQFLATQDTSLGVGVLLVGTTNMVFSINAPVDRTTWKNLTFPIQTISLLDYGPRGPRSTISINGDMWHRSEDGFRSFKVARRNFNEWGNTPLSREIQPVIDYDTNTLLFFGSSALFQNRQFATVSPHRTPKGIIHRGFAVVNYDLISNLQSKTYPAWEGIYSGLSVFQVLKASVNNRERGFAFALNSSNQIELWELSHSDSPFYDTYTTTSDNVQTIHRTAIEPWLETRSMNFGDSSQLKSLHTCEIFLDEIVDAVSLTIKFKPDQYPSWVTWKTISLCQNLTQCEVNPPGDFSCAVWKPDQKGYAARILLPQPPETCNELAGVQIRLGYEFQFRLEGSGSFRIRRFKPHAKERSDKIEGDCPPEVECKTFEACELDWFDYHSKP